MSFIDFLNEKKLKTGTRVIIHKKGDWEGKEGEIRMTRAKDKNRDVYVVGIDDSLLVDFIHIDDLEVI
jgi:hypothetical protein